MKIKEREKEIDREVAYLALQGMPVLLNKGKPIDEVSPWQARRKLGEFKSKAVDVSGPWTGKLKIRMYMVSGASI